MRRLEFTNLSRVSDWSVPEDLDDFEFHLERAFEVEILGLPTLEALLVDKSTENCLLKSGSNYFIHFDEERQLRWIQRPTALPDILEAIREDPIYFPKLRLVDVESPKRFKSILEKSTDDATSSNYQRRVRAHEWCRTMFQGMQSRRQMPRLHQQVEFEAQYSRGHRDCKATLSALWLADYNLTYLDLGSQTPCQLCKATWAEYRHEIEKSYQDTGGLPREIIPADWNEIHEDKQRIEQVFPYKDYSLSTGKLLLLHADEANSLIRCGNTHILYNQPRQELVQIKAPTTLSQILLVLTDPKLLLTTRLRKPMKGPLRREFTQREDILNIPSGWSDILPAFEEDSILPAVAGRLGLPAYHRLLVNFTTYEILVKSGGAFFLFDTYPARFRRIDGPEDSERMLHALETREALTISPLMNPLPNNLVPIGWRNDYDYKGSVPKSTGYRDPDVVLFHPSSSTFLLESNKCGFILWKDGSSQIECIEEPRGLLDFLPLLNHRELLKMKECPLPYPMEELPQIERDPYMEVDKIPDVEQDQNDMEESCVTEVSIGDSTEEGEDISSYQTSPTTVDEDFDYLAKASEESNSRTSIVGYLRKVITKAIWSISN